MNYRESVRNILIEKFETIPLANVLTFGCAQNENDSEKIRGMLYSLGYRMTDELEKSDIVVYNTCAIRENAELKIFGNIGKIKALKKQNPNMIVAVCGCMVMQQHIVDKIKKSYPFVDIVFGVNAAELLPELIYKCYSERKKQILAPEDRTEIIENSPVLRQSNVKASISIMYGCDNFCSYCIVPYVRGRERSRKPRDILNEFTELVNRGYKDITLLGQNVNSYGKGLEEKVDFADLLSMLCKVEGEYVIHYISSHPKDFSKKVIDVIRDNPQISRRIHLPIQSGNNRVLKEMNRKYTVEKYMEIVNYAREQIPDVTFSTDIIVGFPGETFEEYLDTENLCKQVRFTQIFNYIYSKRMGTKAAQMPDTVTHKEKSEWLNRLIKVQQQITFDYLNDCIGKEYRALVEEKHDKLYTCRLKNNFVVKLFCKDDILNQFVNVRITGKTGTSLTAELIKTER
ncbi:MAG: tRNA (N6-isopentenyl adenosine(37)-C2)-methylthiotransferase MiaB [Oscillospiraceae bacterium]|nr:tRNA (N6-isopentenyl adenosine(37)-C2)-methylthiotransferase MiaB [Oscillospiraceae bacterium]